MSIQDEIFQWVKGREAWQQELFLRAAATPELDQKDIEEVASILLGEEVEGAGPRVINRDDLPDAHGADQPMVVHLLADLQNVNAITPGETLPLAPVGLNVVYGKNGAGKTGYSRVFKHAGRSLYRETVLSNVTDEDAGSPRATMTIEIGGVRRDESVGARRGRAGAPGSHLRRRCQGRRALPDPRQRGRLRPGKPQEPKSPRRGDAGRGSRA